MLCLQTEDDDKMVGIRLSKELVAVGERALRQNMMALGPLVLPLSEKLKFVASVALRRVGQRSKALAALLSAAWLERAYVPDFKRAFDHFCIHTGGHDVQGYTWTKLYMVEIRLWTVSDGRSMHTR